MRTTLRIDDQLLLELKAMAHKNNTSLTKLINQVIRLGLDTPNKNQKPKTPYHEETCDLGEPIYDLNKALKLAATLEDEETIRKIEMRK